MNIDLSPREARVIGCLIEKQVTTPEQYPLSLNAIVNACNQKSNRDPAMTLSEVEVQAAIDILSRKHLVLERSGFGSRVAKYQQRFCNTEFSVFQFTPQERAILCELLLRGPQTPGELRSRAARMTSFNAADEVEAALVALTLRQGGPLVLCLAREPGRREARYVHLFSGRAETLARAPAPTDAATAPTAPTAALSIDAAPNFEPRLALLEQEVRQLREQLEALERRG